MTQDTISAYDLARSLPSILRRLPSVLRGFYYYSVEDNQKDLTLGTLIERNAERYAARPAILEEDKSITWGEFNAWTNRYARYFRSQGLKRGDTIAVLLENRPELLAIVGGAAKVGVGCAMLNTSQKGQVLEHSINLIAPKMIVAGEEVIDSLEAIKPGLSPDHPTPFLFLADTNTLSDSGTTPDGYINLAEAVSSLDGDNLVIPDRPKMGDTAVYLFTSGTTGLPKAAPGSHRKFIKAYGGFGLMSLNMKPHDVLYCTLPLYHGTALLVCWGSVIAGGSAIALRRKFSATSFWDDVRRYNATTFGYVGELCRYLLNQPAGAGDRDHQLTKMIGNGLRPSIWSSFKERFGIQTVAELYASSEGNIGFSNFFNMDNTVGFSTAPHKLVRFYDGTRDPVRDDKGYMMEVGRGEPGLLLGEINQKWAFEGYTQKDATEKSILRDAFQPGDQWFNTGDVLRNIGYKHLQFVDRMGDTYRWKGENVSTNEIENILDGSGQIKEAIVYGVEIPETNGKAGMATVVPQGGSELDITKLYKFLNANLPAYAIPVFIRVTDEIETTGTFKYRKVDIQKAGYTLESPHDQIYVLLPRSGEYTLLTPELFTRINSGEYSF